MKNPPIKLLVATRHSPLPENDGAGAYLFDLLSYLAARGTRIDVAWLHADGALIRRGWWRVPAHFDRVARLHLPGSIALGRLRIFPNIWWLPFKARSLGRIKRLLQGFGVMSRARPPRPIVPPRPAGWNALPQAAEVAFFSRVAQRRRPDAVLANYCWLTPLFAESAAARKIVLTHDIASQRLSQTAPALTDVNTALNPARPEGERALLARADVIVAITGDDADVFRRWLPHHEILVTPKSSDPLGAPPAPPVAGRCLFVGSANEFNREGLAWFLREVWPLVREQHRTATLHVCGSVCDPAETPPPGVTYRGVLRDLAPAYAEAAVAVVPLLRGSGLKIKLVAAATHARPCVSTSVGLQGLSFLRDLVPVCDEPAAFARALAGLLREPERADALGRELQERVASRLSPENCYAPLHQWLTSAAAPQPAALRRISAPKFVAPPLTAP